MKDEEMKVLATDKPPIEYPENGVPLRRYNIALDDASRGADGYWEVIRTVKQIVTYDGNIYFIREKAVKSIDKDFAKANRTTHKAIGSLLSEYNDDFFSKEEWDGMQYVMTDKGVNEVKVEEHHGIIEDVTHT